MKYPLVWTNSSRTMEGMRYKTSFKNTKKRRIQIEIAKWITIIRFETRATLFDCVSQLIATFSIISWSLWAIFCRKMTISHWILLITFHVFFVWLFTSCICPLHRCHHARCNGSGASKSFTPQSLLYIFFLFYISMCMHI